MVKRYGNFENTAEHINYQLVFCSATWCLPCQKVKTEEFPILQGLGIIISEEATADIRIVDIDKHPDWYAKLKGNTSSIPLIVEIKDNKILRRENGVDTSEKILLRYDLEKK